MLSVSGLAPLYWRWKELLLIFALPFLHDPTVEWRDDPVSVLCLLGLKCCKTCPIDEGRVAVYAFVAVVCDGEEGVASLEEEAKGRRGGHG
jgi:hypothetical protein